MNKWIGLIFSAFLFISSSAYAVIETYEFANETLHQRYQIMVDELRCPKCQNQNLADSNSPIAADLRRELYRMLVAGESDEAIKTFMVKRYGNFVLYRPPFDKNTAILWATPILLVIFALLFIISLRRRSVMVNVEQQLSIDEKQKLAHLLNEYPS